MAYEQVTTVITREAGQDLSSNQFRFLDLSADGQVDPVGAGAAAIGVQQNDPDTAGYATSIAIQGVSRTEAGGSVTAGDEVAADTDSRAVTAGSGDVTLGVALEDASGAGSVIPVLLRCN